MTPRAVIVAALVGGLAGFVAGRAGVSSATPSESTLPRVPDDAVTATLTRLESKVDRLEAALRSSRREFDAARTESRAHQEAQADTAGRAPEPTADPYATWTDDEIRLAAMSKGDDLHLYKAALRRNHPAERRAQILVALAAFRHKLEWHCTAEREALIEAAALAPTTTVTGAEAVLALAYNYAATPDDRWRCDACFESLLRDAPNEEQRMKGAYGLAWRHDLGDESKESSVAAYRAFLGKWGEKYAGTVEVNWARHRLAEHGAGE